MARIKFTGRPLYDAGKRNILADPQPMETFKDGRTLIEMPSAEFQKQRRVFEHEHAGRIVRLFPDLYKRVKPPLNLERTDAADSPAEQ